MDKPSCCKSLKVWGGGIQAAEWCNSLSQAAGEVCGARDSLCRTRRLQTRPPRPALPQFVSLDSDLSFSRHSSHTNAINVNKNDKGVKATTKTSRWWFHPLVVQRHKCWKSVTVTVTAGHTEVMIIIPRMLSAARNVSTFYKHLSFRTDLYLRTKLFFLEAINTCILLMSSPPRGLQTWRRDFPP